MSETAFSHFEIEKSADGFLWKTIGSAAAKSESGERVDYFLMDEKPFAGENFYRLRMLDFDGSEAVSPVRSVVFDSKTKAIEVFPNPSNAGVWLRFPTDFQEEKMTIRLFDVAGRLVFESTKDVEKGSPPIWLDWQTVGLSAGSFWLEMQSENGFLQRETVVRL